MRLLRLLMIYLLGTYWSAIAKVGVLQPWHDHFFESFGSTSYITVVNDRPGTEATRLGTSSRRIITTVERLPRAVAASPNYNLLQKSCRIHR